MLVFLWFATWKCSLIPASRFWSLAKQRGKAWEKESCTWLQVDVRVDVRGAVPTRCNSQTLHLSASNLPNNELYWRCLSNVTVSSSWTRYYKKDHKILRWTPPPSRLPDVTHVTLSPRNGLGTGLMRMGSMLCYAICVWEFAVWVWEYSVVSSLNLKAF